MPFSRTSLPIGHTQYSWIGLPDKIIGTNNNKPKKTIKKKKCYTHHQFENVKYRRELNNLLKKHETNIQRKNEELCRLKKKVKIQKSKFFFSLSKI